MDYLPKMHYQVHFFSVRRLNLYCKRLRNGVNGPLPKTHTQFMSNICDVSYIIYDAMTKY